MNTRMIYNYIMAKIFTSGKTKLKFFMPNCREKDQVRRLVEKHGGSVVRRYESDCIELIPFDVDHRIPVESAKNHEVYSYKLILDSVQLQELQDKKDYEIPIAYPTPKLQKTSNRKAYTPDEDKLMIEWVEKHPGKAGGRNY